MSQSSPVPKSDWVTTGDKCTSCKKAFGFFGAKQKNCPFCGKLMCVECVNALVTIQQGQAQDRVCVDCFATIQNNRQKQHKEAIAKGTTAEPGSPSAEVPAQSGAPLSPRSRSEEYRRRITAMYAKYNPEKLHHVDSTLDKYKGSEEAVIEALIKKYGPEPSASEAAALFAGGTNGEKNSTPTATPTAPPPATDPQAAYRERMRVMYTRYAPDKLNTIDATLQKYRGSEDALMDALAKKYGAEPQVQPPPQQNPVVASPSIAPATSSQQSSSTGSQEPYRQRMIALYKLHAPDKLVSVDATLEKYRGSEDALMQALVKKYGPEPTTVTVTEAPQQQPARSPTPPQLPTPPLQTVAEPMQANDATPAAEKVQSNEDSSGIPLQHVDPASAPAVHENAPPVSEQPRHAPPPLQPQSAETAASTPQGASSQEAQRLHAMVEDLVRKSTSLREENIAWQEKFVALQAESAQRQSSSSSTKKEEVDAQLAAIKAHSDDIATRSSQLDAQEAALKASTQAHETDMATALQSLKNDRDKLIQEQATLAEQRKALEDSQAALLEERREIDAQRKQLEADTASLSTERELAVKDTKTTLDALAAREQSIAAEKAALLAREEALINKSHESASVASDNHNTRSSELEAKARELDTRESTLVAAVASHQAESASAMARLEQDRNELEKERAALADQQALLLTEKTQLATECVKLAAERKTLDDDAAALHNERERHLRETKEVALAHHTREESLTEMKSSLDARDEALAKKQHEINALLTSNQQDRDSHMQKREQELARREEEFVAAMNLRTEEVHAASQAVKSTREDLDRERALFDEQQAQLLSAKAELQRERDTVAAEREQLAADVAALNDEKVRTTNETKSVSEDLTAREQALITEKAGLTAREQALSKKHQEANALLSSNQQERDTQLQAKEKELDDREAALHQLMAVREAETAAAVEQLKKDREELERERTVLAKEQQDVQTAQLALQGERERLDEQKKQLDIDTSILNNEREVLAQKYEATALQLAAKEAALELEKTRLVAREESLHKQQAEADASHASKLQRDDELTRVAHDAAQARIIDIEAREKTLQTSLEEHRRAISTAEEKLEQDREAIAKQAQALEEERAALLTERASFETMCAERSNNLTVEAEEAAKLREQLHEDEIKRQEARQQLEQELLASSAEKESLDRLAESLHTERMQLAEEGLRVRKELAAIKEEQEQHALQLEMTRSEIENETKLLAERRKELEDRIEEIKDRESLQVRNISEETASLKARLADVERREAAATLDAQNLSSRESEASAALAQRQQELSERLQSVAEKEAQLTEDEVRLAAEREAMQRRVTELAQLTERVKQREASLAAKEAQLGNIAAREEELRILEEQVNASRVKMEEHAVLLSPFLAARTTGVSFDKPSASTSSWLRPSQIRSITFSNPDADDTYTVSDEVATEVKRWLEQPRDAAEALLSSRLMPPHSLRNILVHVVVTICDSWSVVDTMVAKSCLERFVGGVSDLLSLDPTVLCNVRSTISLLCWVYGVVSQGSRSFLRVLSAHERLALVVAPLVALARHPTMSTLELAESLDPTLVALGIRRGEDVSLWSVLAAQSFCASMTRADSDITQLMDRSTSAAFVSLVIVHSRALCGALALDNATCVSAAADALCDVSSEPPGISKSFSLVKSAEHREVLSSAVLATGATLMMLQSLSGNAAERLSVCMSEAGKLQTVLTSAGFDRRILSGLITEFNPEKSLSTTTSNLPLHEVCSPRVQLSRCQALLSSGMAASEQKIAELSNELESSMHSISSELAHAKQLRQDSLHMHMEAESMLQNLKEREERVANLEGQRELVEKRESLAKELYDAAMEIQLRNNYHGVLPNEKVRLQEAAAVVAARELKVREAEATLGMQKQAVEALSAETAAARADLEQREAAIVAGMQRLLNIEQREEMLNRREEAYVKLMANTRHTDARALCVGELESRLSVRLAEADSALRMAKVTSSRLEREYNRQRTQYTELTAIKACEENVSKAIDESRTRRLHAAQGYAAAHPHESVNPRPIDRLERAVFQLTSSLSQYAQ